MNSLLIASTIICFSGHFVPILIKYLARIVYSKGKNDQILRDEMRQLEKEMSEISPVNEFARYTRLQRKHTKIKEELQQNMSKTLLSRNKMQTSLTFVNSAITIIGSVILMYMYGKESVIHLPQKLLWPCQNILSWPASNPNAVSLTSWMILSRMVVNTFKNDYF